MSSPFLLTIVTFNFTSFTASFTLHFFSFRPRFSPVCARTKQNRMTNSRKNQMRHRIKLASFGIVWSNNRGVFDVFTKVAQSSEQVINRALVISRGRDERFFLRENHEWLINSKPINGLGRLASIRDSPGVPARLAGLTYRINASWYRTIIYCVTQFELPALLYDLMSSSRDDTTRVWFVSARCVCSSPAAPIFTRCLYVCCRTNKRCYWFARCRIRG